MVSSKQIQKWVKDGTITKAQAKKMMADTKEQSSNNLIVVLSTIGAILLGIGAILFIASNWRVMPDIVKTLIMAGSTFLAYYIGYVLKYQKNNLPKVGASLIFLGALLFGATIFLIAQIYNITANNHVLMLIWIAGILPLVYAALSVPIAGLSCILFFTWIGLFVFRNMRFMGVYGDYLRLPVLYITAGILLFGIGAVHYFAPKLRGIARTYRLFGINIVMLSLFMLTFKVFSGENTITRALEMSEQFQAGLIIFLVFGTIITLINVFRSKIDTSIIENSMALGLLAISAIFFFIPAESNIYVIVFNIVLAVVILTLLFVGYHKEDIKLINPAFFWLAALIIVRYFDWFWDLLPRSGFFMIGGLMLVFGGVFLEKKRRQLKSDFKK